MEPLTVLYDGACPFCERCRRWLDRAAQHVTLRPLDCHAPEVRARFGRVPGFGHELVVIDGSGRFWIGPAAFLVCLWALAHWRWVAYVLLLAPLRPLAVAAFGWASAHRRTLGTLLGVPVCPAGHCGVAPAPAGPYR